MKKYIFIALTFLCFHAAAAQTRQAIRNWWDLKYSISYAPVYVCAFDSIVNPVAGGGYFMWVRTTNNSSIPDIPGIQIKPRGTTRGYWRRIYSGTMNVDWFGAAKTSTQNTWAGYGYSQAKLDSMYSYFGAGFISTTMRPDYTAVKTAFKLMETIGYQSLAFSPGKYYYNDAAALPRQISGWGSSRLYEWVIEGNGSEHTNYSTYSGWFWTRNPIDQTDADDTLSNGTFIISNLSLRGQNSQFPSGIRLCATFNSVIENIKANSMNPAIEIRFGLGNIIGPYNGSGCTRDIWVDNGDWSGAGLQNAQSNHTKFFKCRSFPGTTTTYPFFAGGASGITFDGCIIDHNNTAGTNPIYGILFDSYDSPNVKEASILNTHVEQASDSGGICIRANTGIFQVNGVYSQYAQTLVKLQAYGGYPEVVISNIPYWPGASKLCAVNLPAQTNCCFTLIKVKNPGMSTVADWILPANSMWDLTPTNSIIPASNRMSVTPPIVN